MSTRTIAFLGMVMGAVALGIALGSQILLGLVPCALCYAERWPYRAAITLGLLGLLVPARLARAFCWLVVAAYVAAAAAAFLHVGVEQAWWKSPLPECTAPRSARVERGPDAGAHAGPAGEILRGRGLSDALGCR